MKSLISLLLTISMCFCLVACGNDNTRETPTDPPAETKEDLRSEELTEILCGGRWVSDENPEQAYIFREDGTFEKQKLSIVDGAVTGTENGEWSYQGFVVNGGIEGDPISSAPSLRLVYEGRCPAENGVYAFWRDGCAWESVGYTADGEWIACIRDYYFHKVSE